MHQHCYNVLDPQDFTPRPQMWQASSNTTFAYDWNRHSPCNGTMELDPLTRQSLEQWTTLRPEQPPNRFFPQKYCSPTPCVFPPLTYNESPLAAQAFIPQTPCSPLVAQGFIPQGTPLVGQALVPPPTPCSPPSAWPYTPVWGNSPKQQYYHKVARGPYVCDGSGPGHQPAPVNRTWCQRLFHCRDKPRYTINPMILHNSSFNHDIEFDLRNDPSQPDAVRLRGGRPFESMDFVQLATIPAVHSLRLVHPRLPFPIDIQASKHNGVTISDVIQQLAAALHQELTQSEYWSHKLKPKKREAMQIAHYDRCQMYGGPGMMRRIEYLRAHVIFTGLQKGRKGTWKIKTKKMEPGSTMNWWASGQPAPF